MSKNTKIYIAICIAVLLYGFLFGCKSKENDPVEPMPQTYTDSLRKLYDSLESGLSQQPPYIGHRSSGAEQWHPGTQRIPNTEYVGRNKTPNSQGMRNKAYGEHTLDDDILIDTSHPDQGTFALSVDSTGELYFPDTTHAWLTDSIYTAGSLLHVDTGQMYFATLQQTAEIEIHAGEELVAYRKRDSAWVFINPDKTIQILDSLYKRCK